MKDNETLDFDSLPRDAIEELIEQWIHSERDRKICHRRLLDGIRYEALGEEFCLSTRQVKQIISKSKKKMSNPYK